MIIKVKVKPDCNDEKIIRVSKSEYLAFLKEKAEDGKANRRLINLLSKEFNVNFRKIKIKNPKSRMKVIKIS